MEEWQRRKMCLNYVRVKVKKMFAFILISSYKEKKIYTQKRGLAEIS